MNLLQLALISWISITGFLVQPTSAGFQVYSNTTEKLFDEKSQNFKYIGPDINGLKITASYVAADPWQACSTLKDKQKYEGKIVIFGSSGGCLPSQKAKRVQEAGGILAGMLIPDLRFMNLANARFDDSDGVDIPVVTILPDSTDKYNWLKKSAEDADNTNTALVDPDPLNDNTGFWVTFSVIIGLFSLLNASLGGFRLYEIIVSAGKFQATLPEICLIMEVGANIERVIMCIDPDYSTGWGIYPFSTNVVLAFLNIPWTFAATALIGSYWNHALGHFVQSTHESSNVFSAEKWKIPIAILCFFLIVWGTIQVALQGYFFDGEWIFINEMIFIFVCVAVSIYFLVIGVRIILAVRKTTAITKSSQRLKKIGYLVGVSGFGILLMFIGLIAIAVSDNMWKLYSFFGYLGMNFMSFAKVIIFEATHKAKSSDTHSPDNSRATHKSTPLPELSTPAA